MSINSPNHRPPKKQQGLGMIEVLIALLVFALGILGMASMQVSAKRTGYDALQRSIATSLARDIVERMRSNPGVDSLAIFGAVDNLGGGTITTQPKNCNTNDCTPTELATHDVWEWEQALDGASETLADGSKAGGLVSPKACIDHDAGLITVAIVWKGYGGQVNPSNSDCGEGLGLYGTDDKERQLVVITTFVEEV